MTIKFNDNIAVLTRLYLPTRFFHALWIEAFENLIFRRWYRCKV